jgi:diadenosine tetraphosphate (Ap4A) HIT family hydrolase
MCILCEPKKYENLVLYRNDLIVLTLNKFPALPGHLLIFPVNHYASLTDTPAYILFLFMHLAKKSLRILYHKGFDDAQIYIAEGKKSGRSIPHFHIHLIPLMPQDSGVTIPRPAEGRREISENEIKIFKKIFRKFTIG